jgi:hypothetical protein
MERARLNLASEQVRPIPSIIIRKEEVSVGGEDEREDDGELKDASSSGHGLASRAHKLAVSPKVVRYTSQRRGHWPLLRPLPRHNPSRSGVRSKEGEKGRRGLLSLPRLRSFAQKEKKRVGRETRPAVLALNKAPTQE